MRKRFDQLAKQILEQALQPVGKVVRQHEVSPDALYVDLWFTPYPKVRRKHLGLLGRLARQPCLIEAYHDPPSPEELLTCVEKQLLLRRSIHGAKSAQKKPPMLYVLSAGKPVTLLASPACLSVRRGPAGLYRLAVPLDRVTLIVLSELPPVRETLPLRLLGAGQTLKQAFLDLAALPPDSWEAVQLIPVLFRLRFEISVIDHKLRTEEEKLLMDSQKLFDEFVQKTRNEGHQQGYQLGIQQVGQLAKLASERLARPLTSAELQWLLKQLGELGADRTGERLGELSPAELQLWLGGAEPA